MASTLLSPQTEKGRGVELSPSPSMGSTLGEDEAEPVVQDEEGVRELEDQKASPEKRADSAGVLVIDWDGPDDPENPKK